MELSSDQQQRVCLQRGYGNCPRYLRGVLVIPTEELEALRRPIPPAPVPTTAATTPSWPSLGRGGLLIAGLVVLVASGAGAGYLFLGGQPASPTPIPSSSPTPTQSVAPTLSAEPSIAATPRETPIPDPTPRPGDVFVGLEITVLRGDYTIYLVDDEGVIVTEASATFSDFSRAPVEEITAPEPNGRHHWRTTEGEYAGYSYIASLSGPFLIREVYQGQDGVMTYIILPADRL